MKVDRLRIKGSGTAIEQNLANIPEELRKLIIDRDKNLEMGIFWKETPINLRST